MDAEKVLTLLGYAFVIAVCVALLIIAGATLFVVINWKTLKSNWQLMKVLPGKVNDLEKAVSEANDTASGVNLFLQDNWKKIESHITGMHVERVKAERIFAGMSTAIAESREFSPEQIAALNQILAQAQKNQGNYQISKAFEAKFSILAKYIMELGDKVKSCQDSINSGLLAQAQGGDITERPTVITKIGDSVDLHKTLVSGSPPIKKGTAQLEESMQTMQMMAVAKTEHLPPLQTNTPRTGQLIVGDASKTQANDVAYDTIKQEKINLDK